MLSSIIGYVSFDRVEFSYTYTGININMYPSNLMENPFFSDYYTYRRNVYYPGTALDSVSDIPCILNQFVFRNTHTNEVFQAEYTGTCNSYRANIIQMTMNHRDFLRLVVNEFIDTNSNMTLEMYTADMLGAPFNHRIEPDNPIECDLRLDLRLNGRINGFDYWTDEGIILINFETFIDVATVNASKLSLSRSSYYYGRDASNTVNITGGEILNQSPGLTSSVAIRLTSNDHDLVMSKRICTGGNGSSIYYCYLDKEPGFAILYNGVEVSFSYDQVSNIRRVHTGNNYYVGFI